MATLDDKSLGDKSIRPDGSIAEQGERKIFLSVMKVKLTHLGDGLAEISRSGEEGRIRELWHKNCSAHAPCGIADFMEAKDIAARLFLEGYG